MHIVLAILAILVSALFWYWRMRDAGFVASKALETANDGRLFFKRWRWQRKLGNPIDQIDDPRLAASGLLVLAAQIDGAISQAEQGMILTSVAKHFKASAQEAEEYLAFGRWIVGHGKSLEECQRRLINKVKQRGGTDALQDLGEMIEAVGKADNGNLSDPVNQMLRSISISARA